MISATSDRSAEGIGVPLTEGPIPGDALPATGPDWLHKIRLGALERFNALGIPTTKHEDWKYTSLRALERANVVLAAPPAAEVSQRDIEPFLYPGLESSRLVFINGSFSPDLSTMRTLPVGVTVKTFADAWGSSEEELLRSRLTGYTDFRDDAFAALNTAFIEDGVVVHIAKNARLDQPIHVLSVTTTPDQAIVLNPRHLIVAEEGAHATVIEDYVSLGEDAYLTNSLTEVAVASNADVRHYMIERESPKAFNINTLKVHQQRDSQFISHSVLFGGSIVRNNVNPVLDGENIHSVLNGIYIGRDRQHLDNHMRVEHRKPQCDSRQYYRGILADDSRGVFTGRIVVSQDAQQTDAVQSNQNLILSPTAQAQTRPQLEIYADDVKCTHGATIGELDEDAMFYLRSRGLSRETAQGMLVYAFASESLERMELAPVRDVVQRMLLDKLPNTAALGEVVSAGQ